MSAIQVLSSGSGAFRVFGMGTIPAGPSWMERAAWVDRVTRYREQGRAERDIDEIRAYLEERGPRRARSPEEGIARSLEIGIVTRAVFLTKDEEAPHLARDDTGRLGLRLVDGGDRLAIWSPIGEGALLNPKGSGLRSVGLVATYARGHSFYESAYRSADVRKGQPVEVRRDAENEHDANAVRLHSPGARKPFGFVQRGRAAVVARRLDAGEEMAGVSMRGPGRGRDDDSAFLLIGSRRDLETMLG